MYSTSHIWCRPAIISNFRDVGYVYLFNHINGNTLPIKYILHYLNACKILQTSFSHVLFKYFFIHKHILCVCVCVCALY